MRLRRQPRGEDRGQIVAELTDINDDAEFKTTFSAFD